MKKEPKKLTFSHIRDVLMSNRDEMGNPVFTQNYGIVNNARFINKVILLQDTPFCLEKTRIAIVTDGNVDVNINLIDRHISKNKIVYMRDGTIIQLNHKSDDLDLIGMLIDDDYLNELFGGRVPTIFNGQLNDFIIDVDDETKETLVKLLESVSFLIKKDICRPAVCAAITSIFLLFDNVYETLNKEKNVRLSHSKDMFSKFITLVNQADGQQRSIDYYADKMCVSQRYLGAVIKQESGNTAKWWIDRAVIARAKVLLRHTDRQIAEISNILKFPNNSFFCKYFRRLTGCTPQEFRRMPVRE